MLAVRALNAYYGKSHILQGVDLDVGVGEVVSLLGRNGVGRSTTVKAIIGEVAPVGSIRFKGREIAGLPSYRIARLGLGYVPENRDIFPGLTVRQNLTLGLKHAKRPGRWRIKDMLTMFPNLAELRLRPGGRMSGGEQQMLTIARTLMGNPSLVLLDEPSEGLSPKIVEQMVLAILTMKKEGVSIVVSEQNLHFAKLISDRAYIIERGRICFGGTMAELDARPDIRDAHLSI